MTEFIRPEYEALLKQTREGWQEWGSSAVRNAGPELARYINRHRSTIRTILDFGCGNGVLKPYLEAHLLGDVEIYEFDPSVPGKDTLPPLDRFDLIITVDVLEHIEPQSLYDTLEWIAQHGDRQFHHIDCNDTNHKLADGRDVHLIIQPPAWWEAALMSHGRFVIMERHVHDKRKRNRFPRTSCTFVLERTGI